MLDAYIIDRIHREQQERARRQERVPLHIERPAVPMEQPPSRDDSRQDEVPQPRGSVVIDFCV